MAVICLCHPSIDPRAGVQTHTGTAQLPTGGSLQRSRELLLPDRHQERWSDLPVGLGTSNSETGYLSPKQRQICRLLGRRKGISEFPKIIKLAVRGAWCQGSKPHCECYSKFAPALRRLRTDGADMRVKNGGTQDSYRRGRAALDPARNERS